MESVLGEQEEVKCLAGTQSHEGVGGWAEMTKHSVVPGVGRALHSRVYTFMYFYLTERNCFKNGVGILIVAQ